MEEIGVKETLNIMGSTVNIETLKMTWLVMLVVIILSGMAVRRLREVPEGSQNVLELIVEWLGEQAANMMGKKSEVYMPLITALFLFLLTSNLMGLIPLLESPTNDLNTTLGIALLVIVVVHISGLYYHGSGYIGHFFKPYAPFVIINIIEEMAKPITLAFRLFGNILAGEILIIVLVNLLPMWMQIPSVLWLGFSIFISCVHAVIFTMLSMAYIGNAVK